MFEIDKNILSDDLSPYLQQHKDNPVNWQVWSKKTLEFAKQKKAKRDRENTPERHKENTIQTCNFINNF